MGERTPLALDRCACVGTHGCRRSHHEHRRRGRSPSSPTSSCRRTGWRRLGIRARTPRSTIPCARSRWNCARRSASAFRSARIRCRCGRRGRTADIEKAVTAPVSLIVSAFAPVSDARRTLTPQLALGEGDTSLVWINLVREPAAARRFGAGAGVPPARQTNVPMSMIRRGSPTFFDVIQTLHRDGKLLAYHDIADGGLFATLVEMAFASRCGLAIDLPSSGDAMASLFAEELGAVVQIRAGDAAAVLRELAERGLAANAIGCPTSDVRIRITQRRKHVARRITDRPSSRMVGDDPCDAAAARQSGRRGSGIRQDPGCRRSGLVAVVDVRSERRRRRALYCARRRGRRSPSCASRASTARWRWRRRSTAPDSPRTTCT